jgi:hypothetical protein
MSRMRCLSGEALAKLNEKMRRAISAFFSMSMIAVPVSVASYRISLLEYSLGPYLPFSTQSIIAFFPRPVAVALPLQFPAIITMTASDLLDCFDFEYVTEGY